MVILMKTTVSLPERLLEEAKQVAEKEGTTLRALLEEGLRLRLRAHREPTGFRLRDASFGEGGLHPDVQEGSWSRVRT